LLWSGAAWAETLRVATWAVPLSRQGPGLLLRDILAGDDPQIAAATAVIARTRPDILVLTDVDFDAGSAAIGAFADLLRDAGADYPHRYSAQPNSGLATGLDMDGNGRTGEARDAQGYGRYAGQGGVAVLSRWPIGAVTDLSSLLWRDLPGATLPQRDGLPFPSVESQAIQRLSSTVHWIVPVEAPDGPLDLLVWSATPPVFDGPEDLNGLRNRDELLVWQAVLDGQLGPTPGPSFVLAGNANLDPVDGDGFVGAMAAFLADPRLQDPRPSSAGGTAAADPAQKGDPALDTADWPDGTPGNLRVSYVLPSELWEVTGAGVFWPPPDDPASALLGGDGLVAGPHHLVWVDIRR
jgi:hypothetical protein